MANSINTYTGDGVTTQYPLSFTLGILSRDYIQCRVGDEVDGLGQPVYRTLEWITDGLVNIQGGVPASGVQVVFTRTIPKDKLIHDYSDGVPIIEENLDESNLQNLMAIHEFLDGRLTGSGFVQSINMNGYQIKGLGAGTDPSDAVTLTQLQDMTGNAPAYAAQAAASASSAATSASSSINARDASIAARDAAQAAAAGMKWRPDVIAATTANITLSGLQTIDTVALAAGDRVLVKNQTTAANNGVYIAGTGAWTRATDADTWAELISQVVAVNRGAAAPAGNADLIYICTVDAGGTLGTTSVTWVAINLPLLDGEVTYAKLASSAIASTGDLAAGTANKIVNASNLRAYLGNTVLTPWVAYTPTFTGFGTVTGIAMFSRRVGDTLEIQGKFTIGTPTAVEARMTLGFNGTNGGVTSDSTKMSTDTSIAGEIGTNRTSESAMYFILKEPTVGYVTFGAQSVGIYNALQKLQGSQAYPAGVTVSVKAQIPISGW